MVHGFVGRPMLEMSKFKAIETQMVIHIILTFKIFFPLILNKRFHDGFCIFFFFFFKVNSPLILIYNQ